MTNHLDEWDLSAALASATLDQKTRDHLDSCIVCRRRLDSFRDTVDDQRRSLEATAPDFERQKDDILMRLANSAPAAPTQHLWRWKRPILAAAAAAVFALAGGLFQQHTDPTLVATPRPDLPIEEILAQTEALLSDDTIPGFDILDQVSEAELDSLLTNQNPRL